MNRFFCLFIILLAFRAGYGQESAFPEKLSLENAISIALNNNPALKKAASEIDASRGKFWGGVSLPSPTLSLEYEGVPSGKSPGGYGERYFKIGQAFEFPTTIALKSSFLSTGVDIAKSDYNSASLTLISRVKKAYYNVLAKEEKLKIAKENFTITEDFIHKAEVRLNLGEAGNLEYLTAKVQYAQAKNDVNLAENELKTTCNELCNVLGTDKGIENCKLTDSLSYSEYSLSSEDLLKLANEKNPAIKKASLVVSSASTGRSIAWSGLLPAFELEYFNQAIEGRKGFYGFSLGVSVPLWFMFTQRGEIEEASANLRGAEYEYKSAQNELNLNVRNAFLEYQNEMRQVKLYSEEILPQAMEAYRTAKISYDAGEISYLEFLGARQTLISAKSSYTEVLLNYNASLIAIEEASGTSLENFKIKTGFGDK
ncbi:MAG: TolC family protein [Acidobacteriota bacterium]